LSRTRPADNAHQRSNYAEEAGAFEDEQDAPGRTAKARGVARQTISDKKDWGAGAGRRKTGNMKIRDALLYRQNLATLIERSVCASAPRVGRTSLTLRRGSQMRRVRRTSLRPRRRPCARHACSAACAGTGASTGA
jgi:hypothetical protein